MNKLRLSSAVLGCILAASLGSLSGCVDESAAYREAFEQSDYVKALISDNQYLTDTPNVVTEYECEMNKEGDYDRAYITAMVEDESLRAAVTVLGTKSSDGVYIFTEMSTPIITPKKGIDYIEQDSPFVDGDGYTVEFDEAANKAVVTLDNVAVEDAVQFAVLCSGTIEFDWDDGIWVKGKEDTTLDVSIKPSAIEGTYIPDDPNAPEITISNVNSTAEDNEIDGIDAYSCGITYSFMGTEGSGPGIVYAGGDNDDYRAAVAYYNTDDSPSSVALAFVGYFSESGLKDLTYSYAEDTNAASNDDSGSDEGTKSFEGITYTKQ